MSSERTTLAPPEDVNEARREIRDAPLEAVIRSMAQRQLDMSERLSELARELREHQKAEQAELQRIKQHLNLGESNGASLDQ